jgi:hypothetical protein
MAKYQSTAGAGDFMNSQTQSLTIAAHRTASSSTAMNPGNNGNVLESLSQRLSEIRESWKDFDEDAKV